jgi:hypothetical protein
MAKILTGLVAAIVIVAGGFFGFERYMQHRVAGEVEAAFEQIRANGGKASHGKVSFDLKTRTVMIADIVSETAGPSPVNVKIASITASGARQPDATRFAADTIEIADVEIGMTIAQPDGRVTYKAPRVSVKDYSGPAGWQQQPASSAMVDVYRSVIEQFVRTNASSVTIPTIAGTMNFGGAGPSSGEFSYSGVSLRDTRDGKIAAMTVDAFTFTINSQQAGKPQKLTGDLANFTSYDFDASAAAAALDPQKAGDERSYRVYRQISTGPYTITADPDVRMRIDGFTIDDVAMRPSRLQLPALLAAMPPSGDAPTPAQIREFTDKAARLYEGMRVGNIEMRGFSMETPQGPVKLAAIRFNLENGKVGEFAFEGLDARAPNGPVKVGRFALKSLDIANLLRMSAQFSSPGQTPSPDQALGMLALLDGIEVKGFVAPHKNTGKPIIIDNLDLNWGQFVGPIPTRLRLIAKVAGPVDKTNPTQMPLVAAGIDRLALDLDLGAAWTEASRAFTLEPVTIEFSSLFKATARVSLANVPHGVFSTNPVQATSMAVQIEAGTLELALRDLGGVDLAVAQFARMTGTPRDAARRAMIDNIRAGTEPIAGGNPDIIALAEAVIRFVETPGQTLVIKLTPRAKVPVLQLLQLMKIDAVTALEQFRVEASTGL